MKSAPEIITEFLETKKDYKADTQKCFRADCNCLRTFLSIKQVEIAELNSQAFVDRYRQYLKEDVGVSDSTIRRRICTVRSVVDYAQSQGYVSNVKYVLSAGEPTQSTISDTLSDEVVQKLFEYAKSVISENEYMNARIKFQILLVLLFGYKTSELAELTVSDCEKLRTRIAKTDDSMYVARQVLLSGISRYMMVRNQGLRDFHLVSDYLFYNKFGEKLNISNIAMDFRRVKAQLGLDMNITFSQLRNTCILVTALEVSDEELTARMFNISVSRVKALLEHDREAKQSAIEECE